MNGIHSSGKNLYLSYVKNATNNTLSGINSTGINARILDVTVNLNRGNGIYSSGYNTTIAYFEAINNLGNGLWISGGRSYIFEGIRHPTARTESK